MSISSTYGPDRWRPTPAPVAPTAPAAGTDAAATTGSGRRFSVLNDFRYLSDADKQLLGAATGERIEPGLTAGTGAASAFAQQLALDRRTGELAPHQEVTGVYLRNAAAEIDRVNAGRAGFRNPYSGDVLERAVAYLEANGRGRADIRL
ncbi:hypothetical protein [Agilicoccus flavus]|uniref:hypothetical protein n=1 Tax=Agilicoccus flavus TaxID=2775968 RepID=UPI001CF6BE5D|nr:hypothetical protein [Agilicoccus flavus]